MEKRRDRQYQVEFRNVSFKYPGSEQYALRNVNMKFEIGYAAGYFGNRCDILRDSAQSERSGPCLQTDERIDNARE